MKRIIPLTVSLLLLSLPVSAQDWNQHRQTVLAQPSLIRYHLFDGTATSPNLAPAQDVADSHLVYRAPESPRPSGERVRVRGEESVDANSPHPSPLPEGEGTLAEPLPEGEGIQGPFEGTTAVRLDAGFFEGPRLGIERAFTVEMRVRLLGIGSERGNNGAENGTLFGLGNGWDSGIRLTTDCPRRTLTFSIGRPTNPMSRNAYSGQPVPYGVWKHIATTWDGETMRIYVDGILHTITDFEGVLTEPGWGFRVGFNGAGVGSVKMDVAEVAVYTTALPPEEVLAHALLQPRLPAQYAELLHAAINAVLHKNFAEAEAQIDKLFERLQTTPAPPQEGNNSRPSVEGANVEGTNVEGANHSPPVEGGHFAQQNGGVVTRYALRKFRADIAALSGNLTQSLRLSASLLAEPDLPPSFAEGLLRRLIPTEHLNPLPVASSTIYKRILDDPSFDLTARQRFAIEKNYAQALFAESLSADGQHAEAKQLLAGLTERERAFNREDLERQSLSAEFTDLYKKYRDDLVNNRYLDISAVGRRVYFDVAALQRRPRSAVFYVATDGKAENPGTREQPFGSLTQARNAIRRLPEDEKFLLAHGVIEVIVRGGIYPVTETFRLESRDSGGISTVATSIVYRAADGERPIFTGGVTVPEFKKVDDPNILRRLPEEARDKVLVAQLPADIVFPPAAPRGYGRNGLGAAPAVEFFIDDVPQQIARWPNAPSPGAENVLEASENSFVRTGKVHRGANRGFLDESEAHLPGIFEYSDPRHERWLEAKDGMMYGYWGHLWSPASTLIERIDPETKQVIMATSVAFGTGENMPYYAFNLLEEIDLPGEWYLDRETNKLYVYPPEGVDLNAAKTRLSHFPREFVNARDVRNVMLIGLHFEEGSGNAIRVSGGRDFYIVGCSVKRFGNWGLGISGIGNLVLGCDFVTLGGGGVDISGGDIRTLDLGWNIIENTFVSDFSRVDRAYAPAVHIGGVGNMLRFNLFCHSPGHAIRVEGMNHIIEFNEVHSISYESDDQAGIDIFGNPYIRGMVFRYNYWHHINSGRECGSAGIRLDDAISSVLMYGNIFFRTSGSHFGGIQIHGGKDNIVDGNVMIDCKYAVSFSPWGERRWLEELDEGFGARARRQGFNPESEVFRQRYPDFAELRLNADRNFVTRNAAIGVDAFAFNGGRNVFQNNVVLPWMPSLFTETQGMTTCSESRVPADARAHRGRLTIPIDSPLWDLMGIAPIPVEQIGLYIDDIRRELPKTEVTPFFVLE